MSRQFFALARPHRYWPALTAVAGALALYLLLLPLTGGSVPLPVFVLAVGIAAWIGGLERGAAREAVDSLAAPIETPIETEVDGARDADEALRESLREKDLLLKEIHHRVKNNLQVIVSLLGIQSAYIRDPRDLEVFTESQNRIHLMALVHEQLYQSKDLAHIDFHDYLASLVEDVRASYRTRSTEVSVEVDVEKVFLDINAAIPCGLIVNELVSNCLKHAFVGRGSGRITVSLRRVDEENYRLSVSDDGVGFPSDCDFRQMPSLGMQLVVSLAAQLQGTIEMRGGRGTELIVVFPAREKEKE